jgi:hypothetical protein
MSSRKLSRHEHDGERATIQKAAMARMTHIDDFGLHGCPQQLIEALYCFERPQTPPAGAIRPSQMALGQKPMAKLFTNPRIARRGRSGGSTRRQREKPSQRSNKGPRISKHAKK